MARNIVQYLHQLDPGIPIEQLPGRLFKMAAFQHGKNDTIAFGDLNDSLWL